MESPRESLVKVQSSSSKQQTPLKKIDLPIVVSTPIQEATQPIIEVPTASKLKKLIQSKSAINLHPEKQENLIEEKKAFENE